MSANLPSKKWAESFADNKPRTLDEFFEEFSAAFYLHYGLNIEDGELTNMVALPNISSEKFKKIQRHGDSSIHVGDVVHYDSANQVLTIDSSSLGDVLKDWCIENMPKLFNTSCRIQPNTEAIEDYEEIIWRTLESYQETGRIKESVVLPDRNELHKYLDRVFNTTLEMFSTPQRAL